MPTRSLPSAFTAIEILVVVVIIGIAAMVTLPSLGSRGDLNAAAAARTLMSDLIYAQNVAVTKQATCYVRFSSTGYSLWTRVNGVLTAVEHPVRHGNFAVTFGAANTAFANVALASYSISSASDLSFDESGSPSAASASAGTNNALVARASFRLTSGSAATTVYVEPFTGQISAE